MRHHNSFKINNGTGFYLKHAALVAVFLLFTRISFGQIGYSFTPSNGTFNEISGTTMPLSGGDADMGWFNGIPIGFTFNFAGVDYTTVSASTKGWMTFGQDISDSQYENNLTNGGTRPLVAPLWDDIAMFAETDFSFTTTGTPGNQVFTAQWLNMKWDYLALAPVISFQIKLYEASGQIQFIYRQESEVINEGSASIGLAGTSTGINNFISLQDTGPAATASTTLETATLNSKPATGQIFSFNPITGPEIQLTSANPAVFPADIFQNTNNNLVYRFDIIVTQAQTTLTDLQITTSGSYVASDLRYLKVYYSDDAILNVGTDRQLARKSTGLGPGLQVFALSDQIIQPNTTGYVFILADLLCSSTADGTLIVNAVTPADVKFSNGNLSGTTYDGGTQTIQAVTPVNATSPAAASGGTSATLTWANPTGCYDQVMIVGKAGASVTGTPSGDGSSYTANLAYGSGTAFDGGFVVYKGTASPQVVTNLTPGTTYYFKFFTRKGTLWSTGIETSITPEVIVAGDFRSAVSGNWNLASTWQYYNGSAWIPAVTTPTSASGAISIRNGHTVTATADVSADQINVNAGGILAVGSGITLTIADGTGTDCTVYGTLNNSGTVTTNGTLAFNATGVYIHSRNAGNIPIATWNTGSTCRITGVTFNLPANRGQAFSNFIWDCASQGTSISLLGQPANISGTFTLINSGAGTNGIKLGGNVTYANYVQTGGTLYFLNNATSRIVTVNNFSMQGGTINMSDANGTGTLNVSGNFSYTGGTITETRNNRGHIVFNGTGAMQTYTSTRTIAGTDQIDFTVASGAYLQMASETTIINGGGIFTLSAGATLGITSLNGIASSGASGNIQTRTRTYDPGANYIYNKYDSQYPGNGLPATITGSLTIVPMTILELTGSIAVNGTLTVNGSLLPGAENYIISGTGTLTGTGRVKVNRLSDSPEFLAQYTISNKILSGLTVEYNSATGSQIISSTNYGNLKLNNTSGENILNGTVTVSGSMTTSAGILTIDPTGFLRAANLTNGGTLNIAPLGKATVNALTNNGTIYLSSSAPEENSSLMIDSYTGTGFTNAEMYLTGGGGDLTPKWHYVAVPMNYSSTNVFTDINVYNLMRYDDSFVSDGGGEASLDEGFVWWDNYDGKGGFNTLETGRGYAFYHSEDVTAFFSDLTSLQSNLGTLPLQWSGSNKTNTHLYGYNILGNSLTCGIDWDLVTETGDVDNAVYYLVNYDIASYIRGVGGINGGTKDIPPLQGFMVKANASGASLNFNAAREHTTQPRYKKKSAFVDESASEKVIPMVKLGLTKEVNEDETMVWFSEDATTGFEGDYDAVKLSFETGSDIYTMSGTTRLGINGLPMPENESVIPVTVQLKAQDNYKIIAQKIEGLDGYDVTLTDTYKGNMVTDLRKNAEYSYSSEAGTFADRFILKISKIQTGIDDDVLLKGSSFNIFGSGSNLNAQLLDSRWEGQEGTLNIYDLTGRRLFTENHQTWAYREIKQFNPGLPKGLYIIEIKSEKSRFVSKINLNF